MDYITHSEEETLALGERFGNTLVKNDVVAYFGDLGAGKTTFTKGLAKALGIKEYVTSPTFNIVNEYEGEMPLYHFDVYRILSGEGLYDIGYYDYLENNGVCVIEWSENIEAYLPLAYYKIEMKRGENENDRVLTIHKITKDEITFWTEEVK